ncbi:neuroligin-2-like [Uloborus diversus]|uniref:neuroligin-2-like n=1 Tax=Uloborus diversus TaxID=327109 RepID=UPI0024098964|nr:neuroligin-2-like [Uloborus diversus]
MKKLLATTLHSTLLLICFCVSRCDEFQYSDPNYKYYSDQDGRLHSRYYTYSNTEFEHAVDDERCVGRPEVTIVEKVTLHGNVRGRQVSLCDGPGVDVRDRPSNPSSYGPKNSVRVFLGIPYAEPPVRKRNTESLQFKGELTPDTPVRDKYPVMVYIHGGHFEHGSGALFPGHMLAASQRVIVVTFNYRLGHLGFLATGDQNSPGNYGLLDQVAALKWVHENIDAFDGDRDKITLFGTGAGAASAAILALSPLSKGLVKRLILQNGAPVADWAFISDPRYMFNSSQVLGEGLGCSNEDMARLVECVATRSNSEIKILNLKPRVGWLPFGPVLDNFTRPSKERVLPESPLDMLRRGVLFEKDFAVLTGINRDQGADIFLEESQNLEVDETEFSRRIRGFMRMYNYSVNAEGIFEAIHFMYHPPVDPRNRTLLREAFVHMLTDRYYVSPMEEMVRLLLKNKVPTYAYVLNYTLQGYDTPLKGFVSSETEYLLLSGAPFLDPKFYPPGMKLEGASWTQEDRNMSIFMMQAWANFAKYGNPTPTRIFNTILWEPVSEPELPYLNLNATNTTSTMMPRYRERESRFWSSFLPFFLGREPPTMAPTLEPGVAELRVVSGALWGSVAVAALLLVLCLACCALYCRVRRKRTDVDDFEDLDTSREVIVDAQVQDTPV